MKWISWPKQDDLWCSRRACQVHGRGINRDEQARVFDQCRQAKEIDLPGEVEHGRPQIFSDRSKVRVFKFVPTARQHRQESKLARGEFDYFHPAFRVPKLFHSCRAWMENGEWLMANLIRDNGGGASLRRRRKLKHRVSRARGNSERLQKGEIVIRGVHLFHRAIDEFVVKTRADPGFDFHSIRNNPSRRAGQKR